MINQIIVLDMTIKILYTQNVYCRYNEFGNYNMLVGDHHNDLVIIL